MSQAWSCIGGKNAVCVVGLGNFFFLIFYIPKKPMLEHGLLWYIDLLSRAGAAEMFLKD
jgi:hypothetical protein